MFSKGNRFAEENMKKSEFEFVVNHQVEKMVEFLIEDYGMSMKEAFSRVYSSDIYLKLLNKRTGLYRYSPAYTYELLKFANQKDAGTL